MSPQKQNLYRVEPIGNKYYLTRDINVKNSRKKIRRLIGTTKPTEKELEQFIEKNAEEIETEAINTEIMLRLTTYKLTYLDEKTAEELETIRVYYKRYTELSSIDEIEAYEQEMEIKYVYGTTVVEGNTLTEEQTRNLLTKGALPDDKQNVREINEVQNFKTVKKYRDSYKGKITLNFIKTLHAMIVHNIEVETAGQFRKKHVTIGGREKPVTSYEFIELALLEIIENYYTALKNGNNPFEEAVMFHHKFESIHPFSDGNGRVGREIFNFMLHKTGYPRFSVLKTTREAYLKLLQLGDEEKYQDMVVHFAYLLIAQESIIMVGKALKQVLNKKDNTVSYNLAPQIVKEWNTTSNEDNSKNSK